MESISQQDPSASTMVWDARTPVKLAAAGAASLMLAQAAVLTLRHGFDHDVALGFVPLFDLDREGNVPSVFSGFLILINAGLFLMLWRSWRHLQIPRAMPWALCAGLFVFLALDELFSFHEKLNKPLAAVVDTSGYLHFAWVVVYLPLAGLVAAVVLPSWRGLTRPAREWVALAGVLYLTGAGGFEMLGAKQAVAGGGLTYDLLASLEELLEMTGMILLLKGLIEELLNRSQGCFALHCVRPSFLPVTGRPTHRFPTSPGLHPNSGQRGG